MPVADSHQSLIKQFAGREASGQVKELPQRDEQGVEQDCRPDEQPLLVRERDGRESQLLALRANHSRPSGEAVHVDHQSAAAGAGGGKSDACRTCAVADRAQDPQDVEESRLPFRASRWTWTTASGHGAGLADGDGVSDRPDPATMLRLVSPVVEGVEDES